MDVGERVHDQPGSWVGNLVSIRTRCVFVSAVRYASVAMIYLYTALVYVSMRQLAMGDGTDIPALRPMPEAAQLYDIGGALASEFVVPSVVKIAKGLRSHGIRPSLRSRSHCASYCLVAAGDVLKTGRSCWGSTNGENAIRSIPVAKLMCPPDWIRLVDSECSDDCDVED